MTRLPLLFVLVTAPALAAPFNVNVKFEQIELRNGQKLAAGTIKSYDHATGKVVLFVNRTVSSVQLELLPEELAKRIVSLVPEETKAEAREQRAERKEQQQRARDYQKSAAEADRRAEQQNADRAAAARVRQEEGRKEQMARADRSASKRLAEEKAYRYFRYDYRPGSGSVIITGQGVEVQEPKEIVGWERRYRVNGTVGLEFYDSRGRSFDRTVRSFEVIVGPDDQGNLVAIDFSVK